MKEEIDEFRKRNGNNNFTQKEMIMYLITKIDKVDDRLTNGAGKISENRTWIRGVIKVLCVGFPILCAVLAYLFTRC